MKKSATCILTCALVAYSCVPLSAQQNRIDFLEELVTGSTRDMVYITTSPQRINKRGLLYTTVIIGSIFTIGAFDSKIRKNIQHRRFDGLRLTFEELEEKSFMERLGRSSGVMTVFGSFYVGGLVFKNKRARKITYIGITSWFYNDLITKLLKYSMGRKRPGGGNTNSFHNFSGDSSMPSGHTSTAFCMASVIATEYDSLIIDILSYGTASIVAFSRLYRDVHWASDTLAAMFLGIAIGKTTHRLYEKDPHNWQIIFSGSNLSITYKFY